MLKKILTITIILTLVLLIVLTGFIVLTKKKTERIPVTEYKKEIAVSNWNTYKNGKYRFSLSLPESWLVAYESKAPESEHLKLFSLMFVKNPDYEKYKDSFTDPTKLIVPIQSQIEIIVLIRSWSSVKDMDIKDYLAIPVGNFEVSLKELKKENINGIDYYFYKREVKSGASEKDNQIQTGVVWDDKNARYDLFTFRASQENQLEKLIKEVAKSFKVLQ
jgi:hypothetical protein